MKFVWDDKNEDIGHYSLSLYDDDDKEIQCMSIVDYTCLFQQEDSKKNRYFRDCSFEAHYCNGFSHTKRFDICEDRNQFGYNGTPAHTLEDIKKYCENYLAQMYLKSYYNTIAKLDEMKRKAEWFESQGFNLEENNEEII